ncbi:penicillin-binding protein activator LpoB [Bradymonadaceae bacterium TMQ3]|uniref:Penicillin-binding protein activator LpoB n=1 Tax=Lujinxingia sediminis TaxID=2480984 RepID=A0ABY0CW41_9DELT|nr:penicillin-binding protein activator LpoB [Lujinxingia sediminis]RDV37183.1 penicillin-binding protein activator LpoB [Bradymonadaceae bacterium TMQ3]RVU46869.1 penicillin-binding protein activator LpoB [Lujinxingia sediminis]TXC74878.1 penicillin-binding protein activator LpoB [Bradymonadales bacterium TMQ1]
MKTSTLRLLRLPLLSVLVIATLSACGSPQYVRDTEEPRIDEYTMSLRFDREDLNRLYDENIDQLMRSSIVRQWDRGDSPVVAIFPMRNETSEHIGPQLDTLLSKFETDLVNQTAAAVVSWESQPDLLNEVRRQQSDAYDPTRLAAYGRQLGAQYFVTGKVYDVAERINDERRVQYFMFVQVINVSTGQIHFQNESAITKGLIR